jgi:capsular polysaccharide export protein
MYLELSHVASERIKTAGVMEPRQETIDLVFASDWKYLRYTAVTLASVLKNYRGTQPIRVFLLLDRLMPDEDVRRYEALSSIHSFSLHQIPVDASAFANIKTSMGISIATYYRLVMHNLLPEDCHKVLYLDSDLIIRSSIDELFRTTFDGALFAGVEDSISLTYNKKFGIPQAGHHVNAGVLLVNVDLMRSIAFDEMVKRYLDANRYRIVLGDQQILAEIFYNSIKYVPAKWNVHGSMFKSGWAKEFVGVQNAMDMSDAVAAISEPAIIHYTLRRKPWISLEHPKAETWFTYLDLTGYASDIPKPNDVGIKESDGDRSKLDKKTGRKGASADFWTKVVPGVLVSFTRIRQTRLAVNELQRHVFGAREKNERPNHSDLDVKLKQILTSRANIVPAKFSARTAIDGLPENATIMANVHLGDIEGGYNESLKTALRTPNVGYRTERLPDVVALVTQRLKQGMFWKCVETAYLYDLPLLFVEVALFGAFASYFDEDATLNERRAFGFILDDMGYYYDARQPSRLERTLNDPSFQLTDEQRRRARALIDRVVAENITKYNKYAGAAAKFEVENDAILVVGQKGGDASIHFAGANNRSFDDMLDAAVAGSDGRTVYFKKHPDTILGALNIDSKFGSGVVVLPDEVNIDSIIDRCSIIHTVSSQVGFEGLLRGKKVITHGMPFYAGWGLTEDRLPPQRRSQKRTIEDLFHVACLDLSVYVDAGTGKHIEMEEAIDMVLKMREACARRSLGSRR